MSLTPPWLTDMAAEVEPLRAGGGMIAIDPFITSNGSVGNPTMVVAVVCVERGQASYSLSFEVYSVGWLRLFYLRCSRVKPGIQRFGR